MATIGRVNTVLVLDTINSGWTVRCRIIGRDAGGDTGTHLLRLANDLSEHASQDLLINVATTTTIFTTGSVSDGISEATKVGTWKTFMDLNFPMAKLKAEGYKIKMYGNVGTNLHTANGWDDSYVSGSGVQVEDISTLTDWDDVGTNQAVADSFAGTNEDCVIALYLDEAAINTPGVGPPYDGTPESLVWKYDEGTDCLKISYDGGSTFFDVQCTLPTLQDALDVLALYYPTESYDAGVDSNGFIRVTTGGSGAGTIDFDTTFQELLGTFVADFWPPELWYEHVAKWLKQ